MTSDSEILSTTAFDGAAVGPMAMAPNDDALLAISGDQQWRSALEPRHPDASYKSLFRPVWYEDYPEPLHKWQSTTGGQEAEPKYGLLPLVFGTLKATFYSMLIGTPIALLAAVYTSEFVDPSVKGPIKSTIEMMASVPSVVLGFIAGLVVAPFVEDVLPALLSAMVIVPFAFLFGAATLAAASAQGGVAVGEISSSGNWAGAVCGTYHRRTRRTGRLQRWLFAGDFKAWLNQRQGDATPGWFLLFLPLTSLLAAFSVNSYVNPWLRQRCGSLVRGSLRW